MAKPFSRKGLHRLECPMCPCYGYFTVAMLENAGDLPECFARDCGKATMQPMAIELALLLDADDAPIMRAYLAKCSSVAHGQAHTGRDASTLESPEFRALYGTSRDPGIIAQQRQQSRTRQLMALRPAPEAMAF